MTGVSVDELVASYPRLYHMASANSWPSIERHGLLSTTALLDLFEIEESERARLESQYRPETVPIRHPSHGYAELRDQKAMSDSGLVKALRDGLKPTDWYRILNGRVFFWTTRSRLNTMLGARAYRELPQTVLVIDTAALLAAHATEVELSPYNSGSTKPNPFARGRDCFLPISDYPFSAWKKKRGRQNAVAELTVPYGVPDIASMILDVSQRPPVGTKR